MSKYICLGNVLIHHQCQWFDIDAINVLFPNLQFIKVNNINLCSETMQYIMDHWNCNSRKLKLLEIETNNSNDSQLSVQDAVYQYSKSFREKNVFIRANANKHLLY